MSESIRKPSVVYRRCHWDIFFIVPFIYYGAVVFFPHLSDYVFHIELGGR